ncbi:low molecular weight phosphatase family protein [Kocuria sp. CPCC 205263]|uniref:low molecular weight phosphatase family protein n=1 Tax=Kocuria sp. CPCC 205263 TaxID=3073555 RepID=UPI0034D57CCD
MSRPIDPAGSAQPLDTHVLARTAEHLAQRYAGVFSADLVERMVFESYAALARTARVRAHLAPLAGHFAAARLAALAHARATSTAAPGHAGVPQVLFVGEHDTGRAQIAAALLAHHAGDTLTVRSAGLLPGTALEPHVRTVLAERGIDTDDLYPKPVTDDVVAGADWVITFGTLDGIPVPTGANHQDWDVVDVLEAGPAAVAAVIDELEDRVQALYERIRAHPPAP